jgi:hypothetical protein
MADGALNNKPSPPAPPPPPPPPPAPTGPWSPSDAPNSSSQGNPSGNGPAAPAVPGGKTSVDTPSLDLFATNMNALIAPLKTAYTTLDNVNVQPGAFFHADTIRTQINGPNGTTGLKSQYQKVISDLVQGLSDVNDAVTQMKQKYKSTEDLNGASATDLQTDFQTVQSDFSTMMSDASGSGSSSSSSSSG